MTESTVENRVLAVAITLERGKEELHLKTVILKSKNCQIIARCRTFNLSKLITRCNLHREDPRPTKADSDGVSRDLCSI